MVDKSPVEVTFTFLCIKRDQRACIRTIQLHNIPLIYAWQLAGVYKIFILTYSIQLSLCEDIFEEESVGDHEDDEEWEEEGSVGEGLDQPEESQASNL